VNEPVGHPVDVRIARPDGGAMDGVSDRVMSADRLLVLELALARRDEGAVPGGLADLIDDEFEEFGASGRRWDRASTLGLLATSAAGVVRFERFVVVALSEDVFLATYELVASTPDDPERRSVRSSVWVKRRSGWKVRFHQGTPVP